MLETALHTLAGDLEEFSGHYLNSSIFDGTGEIEADNFFLSFTIDDECFKILAIEANQTGKGLGRQVIQLVHDYADQNGLAVIAQGVVDSARGFWQKMGYEEGSDFAFFRV